MYNIHGFNLSFNTWKVLYVAEELGVEYEYTALDPMKGEHKSAEHMKRHPLGKTPTLDHDGRYDPVAAHQHLFHPLGVLEGIEGAEPHSLRRKKLRTVSTQRWGIVRRNDDARP